MEPARPICQGCNQNPATCVIARQPLCQQCSSKAVLYTELPTLSEFTPTGDTRFCDKCHIPLPADSAKCQECGLVNLRLVSDIPEEEKSVIPQKNLTLPATSKCWTCMRCSYEYNHLNSPCTKCGSAPKSSGPLSTSIAPITAPDPEDVDIDLGEVSPPPPSTHRVAQWKCECGSSNPVFMEVCPNCKKPFAQCTNIPWKCLFCAQDTCADPCDQCKKKQGWSVYLNKHNVTLNTEKWLWQCKECKLWTRIDVATCFFGHTNKVLEAALEGKAGPSIGIVNSLRNLMKWS